MLSIKKSSLSVLQTRAEVLWPEGLAQKMFPRGFYVDSAGIDSETSGSANFRAISVMGEYGVDLMSHLAKNVTDVAISDFDHVIAMDSNFLTPSSKHIQR